MDGSGVNWMDCVVETSTLGTILCRRVYIKRPDQHGVFTVMAEEKCYFKVLTDVYLIAAYAPLRKCEEEKKLSGHKLACC
jgi:hypothetical protein